MYNDKSMSLYFSASHQRLAISMVSIALTTLLLSACSKKNQTTNTMGSGAQAGASAHVGEDLGEEILNRPSASLGLFVALYLAEGAFVPSASAREGVDVQMKILKGGEHIDVNDAYALLQEFGSVLQVDIGDLLNRSPNRQETLDQYVTGLKNITERAEKRADAITQSLALKRDALKQQQADVAKLDRIQRDALKKKDYTLAAENQPKLEDAQKKLRTLEDDQKQAQNLLAIFKELLAAAAKRLSAIEQNREILIAGLRVIQVPGIEDLGILGSETKKKAEGHPAPQRLLNTDADRTDRARGSSKCTIPILGFC